jgi:hypothetical protein
MARTLSEQVTDLPKEKPVPPAVTPRVAAPPGDDGPRPPAEPVHPGMWLALWVWLFGFSMLALQVVVETCVVLLGGVSH